MSGGRFISWLKTHGWVVNLLIILIGAYFVAGAANSVVARSIRVLPALENDERPVRTPASASVTGGKVEYSSMAARNLLGAMRESLVTIVESTEANVDLMADAPIDKDHLQPCTITGSLRATLVAEGFPEWSLAVVYDNAAREAKVFTINDGSNAIMDDAILEEIGDREIIVRRRDHFERCLGEGEGATAVATARPPPVLPQVPVPSGSSAPPGDLADASEHIRKLGENEWEIDRDYLQKDILENLSKVATQARIVPSFKNGKPNGFKLFSIKPNSFYSQLGLQNGDVIQSINGYEMNSPDKALEIYQKLKDAGSVSVDIQRRGQAVTNTIGIKP